MSVKFINHKQVWTLFDADGEELASETRIGWEDEHGDLAYELVHDYFDQLMKSGFADLQDDDNVLGELDIVEVSSSVDSSCLARKTFRVYYDVSEDDELYEAGSTEIGHVEYRRECDYIDQSRFDDNCSEFDELSPAEQLALCEQNEDDREEFDEDLCGEESCPRCCAGRLIPDHQQVATFIRRQSYECSECGLDVSADADASSVYVAQTISGQTESLTIWRSHPLDGSEPRGEPTDAEFEHRLEPATTPRG